MQGEEETHMQGIYAQDRTMLMYSKAQSVSWKKRYAVRTGLNSERASEEEQGEDDDSDIVLEYDVYCENRDTFIGIIGIVIPVKGVSCNSKQLSHSIFIQGICVTVSVNEFFQDTKICFWSLQSRRVFSSC